MVTLKLTAKRQATFPVEACESLGLKPGDVIDLESRMEGDERVWILRPRPLRQRQWVGALRKHAGKIKDHSMEAVRKSITAGRSKERNS